MDTLCITHVLNALLTISSHTFENGPFKKKKRRQLKIQIQLSVGLHVQECGTVHGIFFL